MKRLWNAFGKDTKSAVFHKKALKQVEKMEKVSAPRHDSEKKYIDMARQDETLKHAVQARHDTLIENVNQMNIKTTEPPERWISTKDLPTRETEWMHRNDPAWEFGFYEPPLEKMPKGKVMFREALELLRAKQELDDEDASATSAQRREKAREAIQTHAARQRISDVDIDIMYKFFRPFERKDKQRVVHKMDLSKLQERIQGYPDPNQLKPTTPVRQQLKSALGEMLENDRRSSENFDKLSENEKREFFDAVEQIHEEQKNKLQQRLSSVNEMEDAFNKAVEEEAEKRKETPAADSKEKKD